jgi:hypothetical protein
MLMLEGNADFFLNNHVKTRIEAFLDMIQRGRSRSVNVSKGKLEGALAPSKNIPPSLHK